MSAFMKTLLSLSPGGMPENRRLMLRVINLMERNSRGDKLAEDYPLEFLYE